MIRNYKVVKNAFYSMGKATVGTTKVRDKNFCVEAQELVTGRTAITAQTGVGIIKNVPMIFDVFEVKDRKASVAAVWAALYEAVL